MKVVIGVITFNCLKYTKLCLRSIKCSYPHEILVIDNGSTDGTVEWLKTQNVTLIENGQNLGVPYCSNTMYDYTWYNDKSNLLLVLSNDMVCLPNAVDYLIKATEVCDASVISGDNLPCPVYLPRYPDHRKYFKGGDKIAVNVNTMSKWSPGDYYSLIEETSNDFIVDMYSVLEPQLPEFSVVPCPGDGWYVPGHRVYRYEYFDKIGYWDSNFYPIYSMDFDYAVRAKLTNQRCWIVYSSLIFEFWSRVLYESPTKIHDVRRDDYLKEKWGSHIVGTDGWNVPFNGNFPAKYNGYDTSQVKISSRDGELERIKYLMGSNFVSCADTDISGVNGEKFYVDRLMAKRNV